MCASDFAESERERFEGTGRRFFGSAGVLGQLNRQEVVQYFAHCDVLWLHTLIETLCLPFLEAMTLKLPIMAPDFDFSRYVCGDAARYYDPWDLDSAFSDGTPVFLPTVSACLGGSRGIMAELPAGKRA